MYGKVYGRFFLPDYLGITDDETPDTCTVSELIETYPHWRSFVGQLAPLYKTKKLFTMFETSDVHPLVIQEMKLFDQVIVPFDYLKEILEKNGITNCVSINFFTSQLLRSKPVVTPKKNGIDPKKIIFLYVGTNDVRKNLTTLTKVFAEVTKGTDHLLIAKTNSDTDLTKTKNIKIITDKVDLPKLASLYNLCDYIISFTRGEGVGMPMVEGAYFGKPVIAHNQGVFRDVSKFIQTDWIPLFAKEVPIDYTIVPSFLNQVFYGTWWEVDETEASKILKKIIDDKCKYK
jgi:glycosyltransferase involved in cell wall biosynthesis